MAGIGGRTGWRKILYTVGIFFGLALLAQQAWQGYLAIQQYQLCAVRPSYLAGVLGLYITTYAVQMVAWALIMRSLHAPLSPNAVLKGYMISFLPRYIPGTVWGYLSRNEWLAQTHHISYGVSTVASLLEAALFLITAVALGAFYWVDGPWKMAVAGFGIVAFGATWVALPWLASRLGRHPLHEAQLHTQNGHLSMLVAVLYLLFWMLQGLAIHYLGLLLCVQTPIGLMEGIASVSLAWALGFVILFVPAGLGVREWSLSALLVAFAGVASGQAAMVAVVSRGAVISAEIVLLLLGLLRP